TGAVGGPPFPWAIAARGPRQPGRPTFSPPPPRPVHTVRWWEAAIALGAVGLVSIGDLGVDRWVQDHRTSQSDAVARVFKWGGEPAVVNPADRKSTRLNSSHDQISYAVFCLK